jgi:hypothetical protein
MELPMTYHERRALASLLTAVAMAVIYAVYVLQKYPAGDPYSAQVFHFWGVAMLILIPVSIAVNIVIQIVLSMAHTMSTREMDRSFSDERDKLILLRSTLNAIYVFAVGFLLAMLAVVLGSTPSVMFIVLIVAGLATQMVGAVSQLYFYRRGF